MLKNGDVTSSKIIGIQFSIMSPDEIRKGSVAEITSKDSYINNKPVINGLFDPRMGVLEPGLICPTDGLDYMQTPGYFGHLELARPVFYMQYLNTVIKILKCVCFKCSKLLISKNKYKQALKMDNSHRWDYVVDLCKSVKRCGEDSEDGCGCLQPKKIKREGMASIFASWGDDGDGENYQIPLTPELVLKIFKRISDEDVTFMGFSPIWSRPDWMICQVLAVPPPAVRPSVKHDSQQRSEDDLTHILVNIIKSNRVLLEKIHNNAPENTINDWSLVLQYHVATMVDNKLPETSPAAHRSGRPFKAIKDRLNGKHGRMRGNLMAKRVDYSARSVITADPNISIRELGIPMKIAKNVTVPVTVNKVNKMFLTKLVRNGPDVWPGAKILERQNGQSISLRYFDRKSILLEEGDIVHRHTMDGDPVLFNRQPTLHRMSMMCHIAKVMSQGDTFRMNVADTKPYNADFDGDEMNAHFPQDEESVAELKGLAAVPYQIVSPANNAPIIGIFQDSMLGADRFTRENIYFTLQDAMNLLMMYEGVNPEELKSIAKLKNGKVSSFDVLSQIMPPLSLKMKNKQFNSETEKASTSNNVVEIVNGKYVRGQMDKGILGAGTKGIIHRVCNDFGNMRCASFVDDFQNIITEYMKQSAFSVGISDLITDSKINEQITKIIAERKDDVTNLIDQVKIGVFENNSGKTNEEEFETKINNILSKAQNEAGRVSLKSLSKQNRFVVMFNAGSKGSEINIQQMTACLGQQNVDGKRIPYGFEHRTLPHYCKYDDSATARGFVENSYINGLSPQELFFHAMGGRVGLIDTAVKTSATGYIQRRLIKALEDLMVNYDMTIRTNKNKIVQFSYGEDSIDTVKVENQDLPLVEMSIQDIYAHYSIVNDSSKTKMLTAMFVKAAMTRHKKQEAEWMNKCKQYIDFMIEARNVIVKNVFGFKSDRTVRVPVAFAHIIQNVAGQQMLNPHSLVDITMLEAWEMIEHSFKQLTAITLAPPSDLFKVLYFYYLSPKDLLINKRFNKAALELLLQLIQLSYKRSLVAPGEMVGMIAAQSIGEPTTQMTLNTFHFAGVASKSNVTRGVPRIEEILTLSSEIKNPSLTVYLPQEDETDRDKANAIQYMLERTKLADIVNEASVCFDPDDMNTLIEEDRLTMAQFNEFENMMNDCANINDKPANKSKWILRLVLNPEAMLEKNITMDDVHFMLQNAYSGELSCAYSDYNDDKLVFRIRMNNAMKLSSKAVKHANPLDQSDHIHMLKTFQDQLLENTVLRGVNNIHKVILRKIKDNLVENGGVFKKQDIWVLDTVGSNLLEVLGLPYVDQCRTYSNDIVEVYNVLGIEAARQCIYNELAEVLEFDGSYVNAHHMSLLCDRMTFTHQLISIFRHGINNDDTGPIAKASFEETPKMFLNAAQHAELDTMRGISGNVMCGQEGLFGTSSFQVVLDVNEMMRLDETHKYVYQDHHIAIESGLFGDLNGGEKCSKADLEIQNGVANIQAEDMGCGADDYNPFA